MNVILRGYVDVICVGLLDDVIIFSEDPSKHVEHVRSILQVLRDHKLFAKVQKCEFNKEKMTFVGYMVSPANIGMDPAKVTSILDWLVPTPVKGVQSFLGFANFFKKIIHDYSYLAKPSTTLTTKAVKFTWSVAADATFKSLQQAFTIAPILQHFQPDLPITAEADASDFALGCILSQPSFAEDLHPICFYTKKNPLRSSTTPSTTRSCWRL